MMKEARLIVPQHPHVHHLEETLVRSFGGFTRGSAHGAWRSSKGQVVEEKVYLYDIAIHDGTWEELLRVAAWVKREQDQEAVYVRDWAGNVVMI